MSASRRVLVVDDEREILSVLREAFEDQGFEVDTATDGELGLKRCRSFRPHAVILDVVMPRENGYRVARQIKTGEALPGQPIPRVILLTGRTLADDPEREAMFRDFSKADSVLYKPVDLPALIARVSALIAAGTTVANPDIPTP